jgi:hypothetical protein
VLVGERASGCSDGKMLDSIEQELEERGMSLEVHTALQAVPAAPPSPERRAPPAPPPPAAMQPAATPAAVAEVSSVVIAPSRSGLLCLMRCCDAEASWVLLGRNKK